jgi:HEAT repeat protein
VKALVQLGPEVAVPLVEAVWKTKAYDDALRLGVIFGALRELGLPETAPPLRPLLSPDTPPSYRHPAIVTLGALRDMPSIATIKDIALNPSEPERIRMAALSAYADYDQDDLFRILETILMRPQEPLELRKQAAEILNRRKDPGTRDLYHALVQGGKAEEALLRTVVDGLRFHGTAADTVPILEQLKAETDEDSTLQPIIDDAIEWLIEQ